jgi:hypothetical protein
MNELDELARVSNAPAASRASSQPGRRRSKTARTVFVLITLAGFTVAVLVYKLHAPLEAATGEQKMLFVTAGVVCLIGFVGFFVMRLFEDNLRYESRRHFLG